MRRSADPTPSSAAQVTSATWFDRTAPLALVAILVTWLAFPWLVGDRQPFDAAPFVAAGRLADEVDELYPTDDGPTDRFTVIACESYAESEPCNGAVPAFVSPPSAIPIDAAVAAAGPRRGALVWRLLGAGAFVATVGVIGYWCRREGDPLLPVVALAGALSPLVWTTVSLGQTTPFLALAAIAPLVAWRGRNEAVLGVLVGLAAVFKLFPVALGLLFVVHRRWRALGWAVGVGGVLSILALVMSGPDVVPAYIDGVRIHASGVVSSPWNGSIDTLLRWAGLPVLIAWVLKALLIPAVVRFWQARPSLPDRWAATWLLLLLFSPQLWAHYLVVVVAAAALALVPSRRWVPVLGLAASSSIINFLMHEWWWRGELLRTGILATAVFGFLAVVQPAGSAVQISDRHGSGAEKRGTATPPRAAGRSVT